MAFGSSPFASGPFGAAGSVTAVFVYDLQSLGYVVNMGGPYLGRHDSLHAAASLGSVVTFGDAFAGAGNVYGMASLGLVARFGDYTTPGDADAAMQSIGLAVRFGHPSAIKFIKRAAA